MTFTHQVVIWVTWHNCYKRYFFFRKMGMQKSTFHVFSYNLNTRFLMKTLVLQITKHRLATQFQMERIYLKWLDNVCGKQYDTFLISKTNLSIKYGVLTMENSISDLLTVWRLMLPEVAPHVRMNLDISQNLTSTICLPHQRNPLLR